MQFNEYLRAEVELKLKPSTFTPGAPSPPLPPSFLPPTCTGSQYNQTRQQQLHKMTKNEVAMCVCARHGRGGKGSGRVKDLGTDEFTSLSKWNDIVVNLGATKNNNNEATNEPTNERTSDKTKQTAYMMATKKPRGELYLLAEREGGHREKGGAKQVKRMTTKGTTPGYITTKPNNNKLHVLPP